MSVHLVCPRTIACLRPLVSSGSSVHVSALGCSGYECTMGLRTLGTRSVGFLSRPLTDDGLPIGAPFPLW